MCRIFDRSNIKLTSNIITQQILDVEITIKQIMIYNKPVPLEMPYYLSKFVSLEHNLLVQKLVIEKLTS